jgi:hypothetical protein
MVAFNTGGSLNRFFLQLVGTLNLSRIPQRLFFRLSMLGPRRETKGLSGQNAPFAESCSGCLN